MIEKIDKIISFNISSNFGFFKKPDVNNIYFTFNIIPKPTLLGILGAIIGLGGYAQVKDDEIYPDFYKELHTLPISIIPYGDRGVFDKRIIKYNNTVGYANKDGGTLNISEQTLINPRYNIYIGLDLSNPIHVKLNKYLSDTVQYEYIPYMGKNEFKLYIDKVKSFNEFIKFKPDNSFSINSIFPNTGIEALKLSEELRDPFDPSMSETYFYYYERLPIELDDLTQYKYKPFSYTNSKFSKKSKFIDSIELFRIGEKIICLF